MSCEKCKHYDENERSGSKGYCTYYRNYVYPDDRSCSKFIENGSSGGCFLTSACCSYLGLPDNCEELTILRTYRDTYLKSINNGQNIIDEYYDIAPAIVEKINNDPEKNTVYEKIYGIIKNCVSLISENNNEKALKEYQKMVINLKKLYAEDK